jgi:hypothetical protein
MNCATIEQHLSAWIDGQLDDELAPAVEEHVAVCAECRASADALRRQDADLVRAFQPHRQAAQRLADRVIESLDQSVGEASSASGAALKKPFSGGAIWRTAIAAAAGFLIAAFVFQPWRQEEQGTIAQPAPEATAANSLARLVATTGSVEILAGEAHAETWRPIVDVRAFTCPSNASVRTGANVRCELETSDGCVVRLDEQTEIRVKAANAIDLERGQIWCRSPQSATLDVSTARRGETKFDPSRLRCSVDSAMLADVSSDGGLRVTAAEGEVRLQTLSGERFLARGETAVIVAGKIVEPAAAVDPVMASCWVHPLLARKGSDDAEVSLRVDALMARIGQAKASYLYEREIRGLGESAVAPLLRYVASPLSADNVQRRHKAMRIAADMAGRSNVCDLIDLLSDADGAVRVAAAAALSRLTGLDQGRPAEAWRDDVPGCRASAERWIEWLNGPGASFARPKQPARSIEKARSAQ